MAEVFQTLSADEETEIKGWICCLVTYISICYSCEAAGVESIERFEHSGVELPCFVSIGQDRDNQRAVQTDFGFERQCIVLPHVYQLEEPRASLG
eukprot:COSAG05_NODE_1087_length_5921_cov_15.803332_2_plen_95_part_00